MRQHVYAAKASSAHAATKSAQVKRVSTFYERERERERERASERERERARARARERERER